MKRTFAQQLGLTLIELITTVAILAILVGLAVPAYDRYTRKSTRTAAKAELEKVRGMLESYYINNKSYTNDLTDLGYGTSTAYIDKAGEEVASTSSSSVYSLTVTAPGTTTCDDCSYEIVAAPQNGQNDDTECGSLRLNALGQKSATGAKGIKCW